MLRGHRDEVAEVKFEGGDEARAAPGVVEAFCGCRRGDHRSLRSFLVCVADSAVREVEEAVRGARGLMAVSPLFGGRALRGPVDRVMASLGRPPGNAGVLAAYPGLIQDILVDTADHAEAPGLAGPELTVYVGSTRMAGLRKRPASPAG